MRSISSPSSRTGRKLSRPVGAGTGVPGRHSRRSRSANSLAPVDSRMAIRSSTARRVSAWSRQSAGRKRLYSGRDVPGGTIAARAVSSSRTPAFWALSSTSRMSSTSGVSSPARPHQAARAIRWSPRRAIHIHSGRRRPASRSPASSGLRTYGIRLNRSSSARPAIGRRIRSFSLRVKALSREGRRSAHGVSRAGGAPGGCRRDVLVGVGRKFYPVRGPPATTLGWLGWS